jgi:hypothetical protein
MKAVATTGVTITLLLFLSVRKPVSAAEKDAGPSEKVSKRLGEKTLAILKGADRVEVFRLDNRLIEKVPEGVKKFGRFAITAMGKEQGKEFAGKLAAVLMKDETYFGRALRCFEPGVGFRIWNGKESVDMTICFGCSNFYVGGAYGEFGGSKGIYGQLAKLAKEAFPDDKEIQELPDKSRFEK